MLTNAYTVDTMYDMTTLTDIAAEYGIDTTTARIRCEGLYMDHLGNNTPLKDREASLIRAAVAR